ncbi:unnamed protein product [Trichobilharzia szidati]|nr:unnamed protein product [Trichobilharzia szidati]
MDLSMNAQQGCLHFAKSNSLFDMIISAFSLKNHTTYFMQNTNICFLSLKKQKTKFQLQLDKLNVILDKQTGCTINLNEMENDDGDFFTHTEEEEHLKSFFHLFSLLAQKVKKLALISSSEESYIKYQNRSKNHYIDGMDTTRHDCNENFVNTWSAIHLFNQCLSEQIQCARNYTMAHHSLHELRSVLHSWSSEMNISWREREFSGTYEEALEISGLIQNSRNHYLSCWYKIDQLVGIQSHIVSLSKNSKLPPEKAKLLCNCRLHEITVTTEDEVYPQKRLSDSRWLSDIVVNHDEGYSTSQVNWKSPIQLNTTTNSVSATAVATATTDKNKKPPFFCRLFNKQKSKQKINLNNQKESNATRKHSKWLKQVNIPEICMLSTETDEKFQTSLNDMQCTLYDAWLFDDSIIEKVLLKFLTKVFTLWNTLNFIKCMPVKWCENQRDLYTFLTTTEDLFSVKMESTSEFQEFLHETRLLRLALTDLSITGSDQQYNFVDNSCEYYEPTKCTKDMETFYYQEREVESLIHEYCIFEQVCNLYKSQILEHKSVAISPQSCETKCSLDNVLRPVSGELIWKSLSGYINNSVQNTNFMKTSFSSSLFNRSSQHFRRFKSDGSFIGKNLDFDDNTRIKSPSSEINLVGNNNLWTVIEKTLV